MFPLATLAQGRRGVGKLQGADYIQDDMQCSAPNASSGFLGSGLVQECFYTGTCVFSGIVPSVQRALSSGMRMRTFRAHIGPKVPSIRIPVTGRCLPLTWVCAHCAVGDGARSPITTHMLDTSLGKPAAGVAVQLHRRCPGSTAAWRFVTNGTTDANGRVGDLLPPSDSVEPGVYRWGATSAYAAFTLSDQM